MSNKDDGTEGFVGFLLVLGLVVMSVMVIKKFEYQTFSFWISSAFLCFVIWYIFSPKITPFSRVKSEMRKKKIPKKAKKIINKVGEEQPSKGSKTLIGTDLYRKQRVYVDNSDLNQHCLVLGTTGSGKTSTVLNFVESAIEQNIPIIYVDGKGDDRDGEKIVRYAQKQGRDAVLFTTEATDVLYNPLASGGFTSKKDRIIELREWSEEHYKKLAEGFLQTVFKIMQQCEVSVNLSNLSQYLDIPNLKVLIRQHSETLEDADSLMRELEEQEEASKDITSLKAEIRNFVNSEIGQVFVSDEAKRTIELEKIIEQGGLAYFSLPATEFPTMSKTLGKLIINDLKASVNAISKKHGKREVFIIFDEFSVFAGEQVLNLINQGRSKGVHALLVTQCLSDIARGVTNNSDHFINQILENCNTYIIHRLNSGDESERIAKTIGTKKVMKYTAQVDNNYSSKIGSVRAVDEFSVHPNEIKNLPTAQAYLISKNKGMISRIHARYSWIVNDNIN